MPPGVMDVRAPRKQLSWRDDLRVIRRTGQSRSSQVSARPPQAAGRRCPAARTNRVRRCRPGAGPHRGAGPDAAASHRSGRVASPRPRRRKSAHDCSTPVARRRRAAERVYPAMLDAPHFERFAESGHSAFAKPTARQESPSYTGGRVPPPPWRAPSTDAARGRPRSRTEPSHAISFIAPPRAPHANTRGHSSTSVWPSCVISPTSPRPRRS